MLPYIHSRAPKGTALVAHSELDNRSDEEILRSITAYVEPTGSEQNMWAYWHTGWESMPPWTKRNVLHWARMLGPAWTVRVLNGIPCSANYYERFVTPSLLPPAMREKRMSGPYVATHSADFVRLPLLFLYGGCWLDVGAILVRSIQGIWNVLIDPEKSYEFAAFTYVMRPGETSIINTWMMSRKNTELLRRWHNTFLYVWGDKSSCDGLHKHPLLSHLRPLSSLTHGLITDDNNEPVAKTNKIMDYGAQVYCLERLRDLVDKEDGWNGRRCIEEKAFLLPALDEMWYYQPRTNYLGSKQFELLTTRYDAPEAQRIEAEEFVNDMLTNTLLMKFCHGLKDTMVSSLADIWDDPEHDGTDCTPGTFAEYLRWGTLHLRQTRELKPEALTPPTGILQHVAMFDPFPANS